MARERRRIFEGFMDPALIRTVQRLRAKGLYDDIGSPIKEGKEAIIMLARSGSEPRIIKVHKIETSRFEHMIDYLEGDPRFVRIRLYNHRAVVYAWARKEFANLKRARTAGVRCPEPLGFFNNVLVLSFIGDEAPAPLLKEVVLEAPGRMLDEILQEYKKLYGAGLVHADMSEYNILVHEGAPWLIDFAQAVMHAHPKAGEFFERDMNNIAAYFNKVYGMKVDAESLRKVVLA